MLMTINYQEYAAPPRNLRSMPAFRNVAPLPQQLFLTISHVSDIEALLNVAETITQ